MAGHVQTNTQGKSPVQLSVCDVHAGRLAAALAKAGPPCKAYTDWREVIDRHDIDVIHVPTPPHWHALISLAAVQAGKDADAYLLLACRLEEGGRKSDATAVYQKLLDQAPLIHVRQAAGRALHPAAEAPARKP